MNDEDVAFWKRLVGKGMDNAITNLSQLVGQEIESDSFEFKQIPVAETSQLMGGPDIEAVGIYVTVSSSAQRHIMLMYDPKMACGFVDLLMGLPGGTTQSLGEMEQSALGELGNIVGSSFLNALADSTGLTLMPSPPTVMRDMAGALLDLVAADMLLSQNDAFVADLSYLAPDREIAGRLLIIPSQGLLDALLKTRTAA